MAKRITTIAEVDVTGITFGIKKSVLAEFAKKEDIIKFKDLVREKERLWFEASKKKRDQSHPFYSSYFRPHYHDLAPIDSQLRGLRKLWRNQYTDSFTEGLYVCTSALDWQIGSCAGELGQSWVGAKRVVKNTLFLYVQHDRLGNVELADAKTSQVIKLTRGSSVCDRFIKVTEVGDLNE